MARIDLNAASERCADCETAPNRPHAPFCKGGDHRVVEIMPNGLYIQLFHGRTDPKADMDDWGLDGPVFGGYSYVHSTYNTRIALGGFEADGFDSIGELFFDDDLLYYNGVWYGDWSVVSGQILLDDSSSDYALLRRVEQWDERKIGSRHVSSGSGEVIVFQPPNYGLTDGMIDMYS